MKLFFLNKKFFNLLKKILYKQTKNNIIKIQKLIIEKNESLFKEF